jgi:hypothetical protein
MNFRKKNACIYDDIKPSDGLYIYAVLTFEEMLLQATSRHEVVHEKPVLILVAVADQFDEVRVPQLPQKEDFRLHVVIAVYVS